MTAPRTLLPTLLLACVAGCGTASATAAPRAHRDVTAGPVPGGGSAGASSSGIAGLRRTFDGVAGGPVSAESWDPSCRGWIPTGPQIQFDLSMPSAIVASATSDIDTTMVLVCPDGRILCNDDTNGLNPEVRAELPAGRYQIFIGTYSQGNSGAFHAEVGPPPGRALAGEAQRAIDQLELDVHSVPVVRLRGARADHRARPSSG